MIKSGREVLFTSLVGSQNYNLNDENSDKDYKVFSLPTFDDLYKNVSYAEHITGDEEEFDIHDIRRLIDQICSSNMDFIETFYSIETNIHSENKDINQLVSQLFNIRDDIANINLKGLYIICGRIYSSKINKLYKGRSTNNKLVKKYGYNTKQALHAYRAIDFIVRYAETDFKDFDKAIRYSDGERAEMLDIKYGKHTDLEFMKMAEEFYNNKYLKLEGRFDGMKLDRDLKKHVEDIIMSIVKINIKNELEGEWQ